MQTNISLQLETDLLERANQAAALEGKTLDAFLRSTLLTQLREIDRDETRQRLLDWTTEQI